MELSQRVANLPPYLFVEISRKIAERKARGEEVISFAIGDPDLPTPQHIIDSICEASKEPENHRYPETEGLLELRQAIARWYDRRFGVTLDAETEVLPLIGSKEGIAHMAFCVIDAGDIALVPNPGYPVYPVCTMLAGGEVYEMPLTEKNGFLPDLEAVPEDVCKKARLLWLNYPNNPTSATADLAFYERAVAFAAKHDIVVCHDGPYSEVAYDGYVPVSFLQAEGAREVGVEFHSLSKSYNMTGWRIGMAVGNATLIDALKRIKSNLDSGIPQAIQRAAITALDGPQDCIAEHNNIYQRRRDLIVDTLNRIGLKAPTPKACLYVWAAVPAGYTSQQLATELLEDVGVVVTPGNGYGSAGEGFIRLSLTISDVSLMKGLTRLSEWKGGKVARNKKRK
jgi:LL-diaminopimelate aminotransferase